jgi:outer membrane cobalamin receptor
MPAELPGSMAADSLLMPTESFVLDRADLIERNIHTLDDVLQLLPGVALWREGPHGADGGFSIDGRSHRGVNLLVNGVPVIDHYTMESLTRFLPLSRLLRVEIVYSGSPCFSGDLSSRGFINLVLEEGGREGPDSEVDFTYGNSNRRARRAWFATPRSYVSAAIAYDEYLQDGIEAYPAIEHRLLGKDDMRSILAEVAMRTSAGDNVLFRFHRYEDSYYGTSYHEHEDVRRSGFGSELLYRRAGFSSSVTQRVLEVARLSGRVLERAVGGGMRWNDTFAGVETRSFFSAERVEFENDLWGAYFAPSYYRIEGGAVLGGRLPSRVTWRLGAFGGDHSAVGRYGSAEVAIAKGWSERFFQDVTIARRLRIPSAEELFQPVLSRTLGGESYATVGNPDLSPAVADELSLGFRLSGASLSLFGRNEKSVIVLSEASPAVFRSEGSGAVAGLRAHFSGGARILGIDCNLSLGVEGYPERKALSDGVPRYRARGEAGLRRRIFSGTELISIKLDSELAGEREWCGATLPVYHVHNVAASLSIMSTRLSFEYKNILNVRYETVPGYTMPPRHFIIGVFWELFD